MGFIIAWLLMCGVILIRYFWRVWVSARRVCDKINVLLEQSSDEYRRWCLSICNWVFNCW